jgi:hypothetical protein
MTTPAGVIRWWQWRRRRRLHREAERYLEFADAVAYYHRHGFAVRYDWKRR